MLNSNHIKDLAASGLTEHTIQASKCFSVTAERAAGILGFSIQCEALAFPYPGAKGHNGTPAYIRLKPDTPYQAPGWSKSAKYLSPSKSKNRLYIAPTLDRSVLQDSSVALLLTEGEKKTLKAIQEGFPTLSFSGVWNWSAGRDNETGQRHVIPDIDLIEWQGRTVYLCYDSDTATNPSVHAAEKAISHELQVRGASVHIARLPALPDLDKTGLDDYLIARGPEGLRDVLAQAEPFEDDDGDEDDDDDEGGKRPSQADQLVNLALQSCELFCDHIENPYALVYVRDHSEVLRVQGRTFRRWMSRLMYEACGKAPGSEAVATALNVIEARAVFDGQKYELHNRVAYQEKAILYDLTNPKWQAVRVTENGWQIINDPPIIFNRHGHQAAQVEPVPGGDVTRLFDFIAVADDDARLLLLVFLVAALVPNIPHPVPILHGPQGAGKSSCFRVLRRLIDPSAVEILSFPRDSNELVQKLSHHWFVPFDNVTGLQVWQSDALCRAVTGEGFSKRQLYTDDEDIIYTFRRVIGLNGINVAATRADLLDRSILIGLERISPKHRRTESELWAEFDEARPYILGGIFDALSKAMKFLPSVRLTTMPRMADFARWGAAIAQALGYTPDDFLKAYGANIEAQNEEVLQGNPVAAAVMAFMRDRSRWEGAPSELLAHLDRATEDEKIDTRSKTWPKAAHVLTRRLMEVKPNLLDAGISITITRSATSRTIALVKGSDNSVTSVTSVINHKKQNVMNDATDDANDATGNSVTGSVTNKMLKNNADDANDANDATFRPKGVGVNDLLGGRL